MSTAALPKLLTAEEFFRLPDPPDGSKQELVRGEVVTMPPPGIRHGVVQTNIACLIQPFARTHKLGRVTVESGVRTEEDPDSVRGPDVAFWGVNALPVGPVPVGYADLPADLVVEVMSPSDSRRAVVRKVNEYLTSGTRMVWVVDPDDRNVAVYRQAGEGRILWEDATISGEDVLPGFECKVADFFDEE
jgi:Uma2 family endonuclease